MQSLSDAYDSAFSAILLAEVHGVHHRMSKQL